MIYKFGKGSWQESDLVNPDSSDLHVCLISPDDIEKFKPVQHLDNSIISQCLQRKAFTFDHQDDIDYIGVLFLDIHNLNESGDKLCVCIGENLLVFVHENSDQADIMIRDLIAKSTDVQPSVSTIFISFMEKAIVGHIEQHELIEDEIALLENAFLTDKKNIGPNRILVLQKKLLVYKRFYEQLQNVLDDVQETKHPLINEENLRLFTLYTRRIERLLNNVLVLREYVTQVRESYEAETDISLNRIMRLFTVVTVIFLPLTLIVGWYGMNLKMPEYQWIWGYPLVIFISIIIVVFTIVFFKKNKWF